MRTLILLLLVAFVLAVRVLDGAPATLPPPIRCSGTKPASLCDPDGRLSYYSRTRILRTGIRLAQKRCEGQLIVILGVRQVPTSSSGGCIFRITHDDDGHISISVTGGTLSIEERLFVQKRMAENIVENRWKIEDALLDGIYLLLYRGSGERIWVSVIVLTVSMLAFYFASGGHNNKRNHYQSHFRSMKATAVQRHYGFTSILIAQKTVQLNGRKHR